MAAGTKRKIDNAHGDKHQRSHNGYQHKHGTTPTIHTNGNLQEADTDQQTATGAIQGPANTHTGAREEMYDIIDDFQFSALVWYRAQISVNKFNTNLQSSALVWNRAQISMTGLVPASTQKATGFSNRFSIQNGYALQRV